MTNRELQMKKRASQAILACSITDKVNDLLRKCEERLNIVRPTVAWNGDMTHPSYIADGYMRNQAVVSGRTYTCKSREEAKKFYELFNKKKYVQD